MSIVDKLFDIFEDPMRSSDWDKIRQEIKWDFIKETNRGVKLKKKKCEQYKNMETGEIATYYRTDTKIEWHHFDEQNDWPSYVELARKNGECWNNEFDDGRLPEFWGQIMSKGGRIWYKE